MNIRINRHVLSRSLTRGSFAFVGTVSTGQVNYPLLRRGTGKWGLGEVGRRRYGEVRWHVDMVKPGDEMAQKVVVPVVVKRLPNAAEVRGLVLWWGLDSNNFQQEYPVGSRIRFSMEAVVLMYEVGAWIPYVAREALTATEWEVVGYQSVMQRVFWGEWEPVLRKALGGIPRGPGSFLFSRPGFGGRIGGMSGCIRLDMLMLARLYLGRLGYRWSQPTNPVNQEVEGLPRTGLGIVGCIGRGGTVCIH